jgi:hypothetical protein
MSLRLTTHHSAARRIDPLLMIIVGYVFGIRSERLLCREVQVAAEERCR